MSFIIRFLIKQLNSKPSRVNVIAFVDEMFALFLNKRFLLVHKIIRESSSFNKNVDAVKLDSKSMCHSQDLQ